MVWTKFFSQFLFFFYFSTFPIAKFIPKKWTSLQKFEWNKIGFLTRGRAEGRRGGPVLVLADKVKGVLQTLIFGWHHMWTALHPHRPCSKSLEILTVLKMLPAKWLLYMEFKTIYICLFLFLLKAILDIFTVVSQKYTRVIYKDCDL